MNTPISLDCLSLLERTRRSDIAIGNAIELFRFPLPSAYNFDRKAWSHGWDPQFVELSVENRMILAPDFASHLLSNAEELFGESNPKISLVGYEEPRTDNCKRLRLGCARTDWHQARATQTVLQRRPDRRLLHQFFRDDLVRPDNPNILCLHLAVVTSDRRFLGLIREKTAYSNYSVAVSFEEQLKPSDLTTDFGSTAEHWFRRGICEEVFPLKKMFADSPKEAWQKIRKYVRSKSIISGLFEERIGGIALFGICELQVEADEYWKLCLKIREDEEDDWEKEGSRIFLTFDAAQGLLDDGETTFKYFADPSRSYRLSAMLGMDNDVGTTRETLISDEAGSFWRWLHPTSLYRLRTSIRCLERQNDIGKSGYGEA